jgi:MoxR-like ATPase
MTSAVQDGDGKVADGVVLSPEAAEHLGVLYARIVESVQSVLYAEHTTVQLAVGCLLAQGHLLVEDFPGLGKTTLAKALARSLGLDFHRVQFTADLLPADVTGAMVLDRDRGEPTFRPGPIFTNVLMADELNRASARSQSALLEAMEERQVTADGVTMPLPQPFMVLATQNPYDAAGTSPLPHGQRDRFLLRLSMGYPSRAHEDRLLARADTSVLVGDLGPALGRPDLDALLRGVKDVHVSEAVRSYILDIITASRTHPALAVGASPRGALALRQASCAMALAAGRHYVVPIDVQRAAEPALGHRLLLVPGTERSGTGVNEVVEDLVHQVPLPGSETLDVARTRS